jgi:hypothetical protein
MSETMRERDKEQERQKAQEQEDIYNTMLVDLVSCFREWLIRSFFVLGCFKLSLFNFGNCETLNVWNTEIRGSLFLVRRLLVLAYNLPILNLYSFFALFWRQNSIANFLNARNLPEFTFNLLIFNLHNPSSTKV